MKKFEIIDHTADIGIKVYGRDLRELFCNAAVGMFSLIAEKKADSQATQIKKETLTVEQTAENSEELMVGWLRELLFQSTTKEFIPYEFLIEELTENQIKAKVNCEKIDSRNFELKTEIKAVTYHELKVEKVDSAWQAQIIFDV